MGRAAQGTPRARELARAGARESSRQARVRAGALEGEQARERAGGCRVGAGARYPDCDDFFGGDDFSAFVFEHLLPHLGTRRSLHDL